VTDTLRVSTASEGRPRKMAEEQNLTKGASYVLSATVMQKSWKLADCCRKSVSVMR
jgi:hypothetical protein